MGSNQDDDYYSAALKHGLKTEKVGIINAALSTSEATIVALHILSGSSSTPENAPILKVSTKNSMCFSECIVEIILDLEPHQKQ